PQPLKRRARTASPSSSSPIRRAFPGKWSGTEVKIDGEDLLIMKEAEIMGIIG
ncbi:hypothetical protein ACC734_38745, partial [Rhizobium ruizarguesonis]